MDEEQAEWLEKQKARKKLDEERRAKPQAPVTKKHHKRETPSNDEDDLRSWYE